MENFGLPTWSTPEYTRWKGVSVILCRQLESKYQIQLAHATAIQMLSYANQRPGHILENVMRSEGRSDSGPHLLPNPNAGQGSSFMPASAFFSWSAKRSGLNFRGSGYVRLSWRMALTDSQVYNLKNNIRAFHTKH